MKNQGGGATDPPDRNKSPGARSRFAPWSFKGELSSSRKRRRRLEQRFRKLPVPIRPAITKNQAKRHSDGRQTPNPSPRTPVHLYAYAAQSRPAFFWLTEILRTTGLKHRLSLDAPQSSLGAFHRPWRSLYLATSRGNRSVHGPRT